MERASHSGSFGARLRPRFAMIRCSPLLGRTVLSTQRLHAAQMCLVNISDATLFDATLRPVGSKTAKACAQSTVSVAGGRAEPRTARLVRVLRLPGTNLP